MEIDAAVVLNTLSGSSTAITGLGRNCAHESDLFRAANLGRSRFELAIGVQAKAHSKAF